MNYTSGFKHQFYHILIFKNSIPIHFRIVQVVSYFILLFIFYCYMIVEEPTAGYDIFYQWYEIDAHLIQLYCDFCK